jgi:hypothetical protein
VPDIPLLAAGHTVKLPLEINLAAVATGPVAGVAVRVDIRCDSGAHAASHCPGLRECLLPCLMPRPTCAAIIAKNSKGAGFNISSKTLSFAQLRAMWATNLASKIAPLTPGVSARFSSDSKSHDINEEEENISGYLPKLMSSLYNAHTVGGDGPSQWYFCSTIRRGASEDKVIFQCTVDFSAENVEFKLYCDDVMQCTSFMQFLAAKSK